MELTRGQSIAALREGQKLIDAGEIAQLRDGRYAGVVDLSSGECIDGYCSIGYLRYEASGDGTEIQEQDLGLSDGDLELAIDLNDKGKTFAEIADALEAGTL